MKKIVSIGILLLVLVAFSGIASASWVTDKKSSSTHDSSNGLTQNSYVIHYSKNHIVFHYTGKYYSWNYYSQSWGPFLIITFKRDYKKISKKKILEKDTDIENGYYYGKKHVVKTSYSPYYLFKKERHHLATKYKIYDPVQSIFSHD